MRRKAKSDLFFLAHLLGWTKLTPKFHGDYTRWLQKHRGDQYKLTLLPRGHYNSTVVTITDSIQMALPNVAGLQEHPYNLGPLVKILIAHEVREKAADFLYDISLAFTRCEPLLALFPECIPTKKLHRMNKWELELPGNYSREATFNTIGAGGAAQGGHYNWLKLDDLVGKAARDSAAVMKDTISWFNNILALTTDAIDGFNLTGTRWGYGDVYSHAMEVYGIDLDGSVTNCLTDRDLEKFSGGLLKVYARSVIENGVPIYPELMTPAKIKVLRADPQIWAAQFMNNPVEAELIEFTWPLKFYNVDFAQNIVIFTGDSSRRVYTRDLDVCVFCDPSMGESEHADETGIVVTGVDSRNNIYLLETIKKHLRPPALIEELFRLNTKYRPRLIAVEEVNFSAIYRYWLESKAKETATHLPIRRYKPGTKRSKDARIRGLGHFFASGQVFVHEGMHDFRDEYEQFPMGKSKHLLDALAQGPDFWSKGTDRETVERQQREIQLVAPERSILTGY